MQTSPAASCPDTPAAVQRLIALYEQLSPAHLARLGDYYAPDAQFKDPFNDVRGVPAIAQVFAHMFDTLEQPRFVAFVEGGMDRAVAGCQFDADRAHRRTVGQHRPRQGDRSRLHKAACGEALDAPGKRLRGQ